MESGELFYFCGRLCHDGQSLKHIGLLALLVIRAGVNVEVSAGHGVERDLIRGRNGEDRIAASGGVNVVLRDDALLEKTVEHLVVEARDRFGVDHALAVDRAKLGIEDLNVGERFGNAFRELVHVLFRELAAVGAGLLRVDVDGLSGSLRIVIIDDERGSAVAAGPLIGGILRRKRAVADRSECHGGEIDLLQRGIILLAHGAASGEDQAEHKTNGGKRRKSFSFHSYHSFAE